MTGFCGAFQALENEKEDTNDLTAPTNAKEVDEKLYSRQLYVMGHEAQRKMMSSNVLLIGMSGLGVEIAKNCILAGINKISILDPGKPTSYDLGGNFFLQEFDISRDKTRAELCRDKLAELNRYVTVEVSGLSLGNFTELLRTIPFTTCVVVSVPLAQDILSGIDTVCRRCGCVFIYTVVSSVFGQIFCDFGPNFTVTDADGENPATMQIETVLPGNPPVVKVLEDHGRHGLETGDVVTFSRVVGLSGMLSDSTKEYTVKVTGPYTFELTGARFWKAKEPATQGYITQVKKPVIFTSRSYSECMAEPKEEELMMSDFSKLNQPKLLHLGFKALSIYREKKGASPTPGNLDEIMEIIGIAAEMDEDDIISNPKDRYVVKALASGAKAILSPICAAVGGIAAQEVLKACSGKFRPIQGFLYLDAAECLPPDILPMDELSPTGTRRYDSQVAVFGKTAQAKLEDLNYFLVGAGAIGCEMLKNWALMGIGCGKNGMVHVTDMDRIEKSNLSRQFLFRDSNINEFKSSCAAEAVKNINEKIRITAYQEKVCPDTEQMFGDDFYDKINGVCTALDNVDARLYMDQRCVFYGLPMFESGTLGTKGNTQVVVPHVTENYGATRDPPEKSIPVCTLKNFPNQIQHTLQWARDYFEGIFKQSAEDVNSYLGSDNFLEELKSQQNTKVETARNIRKTLVDERPQTFDDCIVWARLKFEENFNNQILQLLYNFPEDQVTTSGAKFWSGSKRCPKVLNFDIDHMCEDAKMTNHFDFIVAAANLRAQMYGIAGRTDRPYIIKVLSNIIVPSFSPKKGVKIAADEAEAKENDNDASGMDISVDAECDEIFASLPTPSELSSGAEGETPFRLNPIDFDKDVDEHMLFVTACSNLRALNYGIPTEDTHRSRAIAGRIIPAIATTTALVTGLICLEIYKVVGTTGKKLELDMFKNAFLNLAIPFITLSEPSAPSVTKAIVKGKEWNWTAWDCISVNEGDITLQQFFQYFDTEYNLEISMLSQGVSILYSFFANKKKVAERMKMPISQIVQSITKKEFPPNQLFIILELIANDKSTDEEVELPYVKFRFR